jgi:RND family efflux transporter MFP subunit
MVLQPLIEDQERGEWAGQCVGNDQLRRKRVGRVVPVLLLVATALAGCGEKQAAAPAGPRPALPVSVVTLQPMDVPLTGEWVGIMDGYVNATIQPQVSGYLIRQAYREGSVVGKDQVLFEIDPRPFQASLDQAEGQLGEAKAQLALARINVARDTPLVEARALAKSQLDNDTQQAAQYAASVEAAQAGVESAQLNLGFTKVRSLIGGVAGQATTQVGNLVNSASTLTSVSQLDPIKVFFAISDAEYLTLTRQAQSSGASLLRSGGNIPLTLTLADGHVYPHKGRIVFVDRQLTAQTGAIRIAAAFPNPGNILRPNQFGRVKAETEVRHDALMVPQAAVQELQGQQQVFTVGADHEAHVVNVELGPQHGSYWIINSGLSPGASVITDNLQKLRDGAPVDPHAAVEPAVDTTSQPARK